MANMNRRNSARFLDAFIEIEQALEKVLDSKQHRPFYQLVDETARKDPFIRDIAVELKEYGDLRNAIVHERLDGEPIAEPHIKVVERLEKIGSLLKAPPLVGDEFCGEVITCSPGDPLRRAVQQMFKRSFSKMPVYDGDRFVGLLTAEAVAYWLGDQLNGRSCDLHKETVESVLKYREDNDNYRFVAKDCPVFEVLEMFEASGHRGRRLHAVLITEDGAPNKKPLGIITMLDLPRIYQISEGR